VSKIEVERKSIPLFEVVEHIVGDLGRAVLQYEDIEESGTTQVAGMDFRDQRARRALVGNWEVLLPIDEATGLAWEGAWKKLSAAVRNGKLLVRGFPGGSKYSEEIKSEEFPELWHNRFSDFDFNVEYGGRRFLEFDERDGAEILNGHSLGPPEVIWTGLCAVSGAEVLGLWPSQPPHTNGTEDKGLVEVTPPLQGDAGPPEVGTDNTATTPTKVPSRKVLGVAKELKRLYPDGSIIKTIADLAKDLKISESTVKRAFWCNGWSRTRGKPATK
jgi:hypothetical protein